MQFRPLPDTKEKEMNTEVYATTSSFSQALQIAHRNKDRGAYAIPAKYVRGLRAMHTFAVCVHGGKS